MLKIRNVFILHYADGLEEKLLAGPEPLKAKAALEPDPDNVTDAGWQLATHSYC